MVRADTTGSPRDARPFQRGQSRSVRRIWTASASEFVDGEFGRAFIGNRDNVSINIRETHVGRLWGSFTDAALRPWRPGASPDACYGKRHDRASQHRGGSPHTTGAHPYSEP